MIPSPSSLIHRLGCPVFEPGDPEYATEVATFHTNTVHTPQVVVGVEETGDVVDALNLAREAGLRVTVQSGRHGTHPATEGMLISTHRMNKVSIDAESRIATIGGGARWSDVLPAAGAYGLMPIIGSSSDVGVAGYLTGGGLGPLARSHGISSDYVERFTVVTAAGEVLEASVSDNPDLFWALRGGKAGLGIITEVRLRLVDLATIYAGSLIFEEEHIEAVFRGWTAWTQEADSMVTTSTAIIDFPDLDFSPPPFRGKRVLMLRFAYPGEAIRGEELAAPLRALAPIFMDDLGQISTVEMDRIHMDPTDPMPAWYVGGQLGHIDDAFATTWLERFGAGTKSPFAMAEFRHGGEAVRFDVPEGSAVTGRNANYTMFLIAMFPPLFAEAAPAAANDLFTAVDTYLLPEMMVNLRGEHLASNPWAPETQARLDTVRAKYDPEGMFALRW